MKRKVKRREFGKYLVADPEICHGQLTFKGTHVFVKHVLEQVAEGEDWSNITADWDHAITTEAIAEAVRLASQALLRQAEESEQQMA